MPGIKDSVVMPLVKLKRFLSIFVHNARGMIGLIIILLFAIMALGAPLLTPYDPVKDKFIAGSYAAPLWLKYVPASLGGWPGASENFQIRENMDFNDSLAGLTNTTAPHVNVSYASDVGAPGSENGSAKIAFERNETGKTYGNVTVSFYKQFHYPYSGYPRKFIADFSLLLDGSTKNVNISFWNETSWQKEYRNATYLDVNATVLVYLQRIADGKVFPVWPYSGEDLNGLYLNATTGNRLPMPGTLFKVTGTWIQSSTWIPDSDMIKYPGENDLIPVIFPPDDLPGDYIFGVNLTFVDRLSPEKSVQATVYVDDFAIDFMGKVWGIMGADHYGADLWSQLVYGARISLYVGLVASILSVVLGLIVGLAAGYSGRYVDELLMRFSDMLLVIPTLPLLIVLIAVLGPALENLILLIGLLGWMGFARVVRSQVLSIKERPFVEAAKAVGAGKIHIMTKHILPNVISLVYVSLATSVPGAIVAEAALSFLGFYDPNKMSWGRMLYEVQANGAAQYWWWVIPPGLCIALLAVAFILLGFALDEVFNPRLRMRR